MAKIPYVEKENCTGEEICVQTCPEVFQMSDDGVAEVHNPTGASEEEIQEAMDACPTQCIHWKEE